MFIWEIESQIFDPLKDEGEYIGGYNSEKAQCTTWEDALNYFIKQVQSGLCAACWVTATLDGKPYNDGEPILSYCA